MTDIRITVPDWPPKAEEGEALPNCNLCAEYRDDRLQGGAFMEHPKGGSKIYLCPQCIGRVEGRAERLLRDLGSKPATKPICVKIALGDLWELEHWL